jgi:hypothetical protein
MLSGYLAACEKELKERGKMARCPVVVNISRVRTGKGKKR